MKEQTFVIIKPDAVSRKLVGKIITRFEAKNLMIKKMKLTVMEREAAKEHYAHLKERDFFEELVDFMTSGPSVFLILEGDDAISVVRRMIGTTNALEAEPGSIRGDFGEAGSHNIVHASDSSEAALIEIRRFFTT